MGRCCYEVFFLTDPSAGHDGQSLYIQPSRAEQAYLTGQSFFVTCFLGADVDRQQVMWRDPEGRPITENEGRIHVYRRRDEPEGIQLVVEEVCRFRTEIIIINYGDHERNLVAVAI